MQPRRRKGNGPICIPSHITSYITSIASIFELPGFAARARLREYKAGKATTRSSATTC